MLRKAFNILTQIIIIYVIYISGIFISGIIAPIIVIPGNIIGMVILLILLSTKILKLSLLEETGNFLLKYMGFFFVALAVGVMDTYELIQESFVSIMIILVVSCLCVMFVSSKVTDILITHLERKKAND